MLERMSVKLIEINTILETFQPAQAQEAKDPGDHPRHSGKVPCGPYVKCSLNEIASAIQKWFMMIRIQLIRASFLSVKAFNTITSPRKEKKNGSALSTSADIMSSLYNNNNPVRYAGMKKKITRLSVRKSNLTPIDFSGFHR